MLSLFVVHAEADTWFVHGELLPALGLAADQVKLSRELPLGELKLAALERFVESSDVTVVVVSPAFVADDWSQFTELLANHASVEDGRQVVPLLLDGGSRSLWTRARVCLDLCDRERWNGELAKLAAQLGRDGLAAEAEQLECPYPGMRSLGAGDAARLFGRDRELEDVVERIRSGQREIFLVGPSGSGKSSLVAAGVVPRLAQPSARLPGVVVRQLRPGPHPAQRLREALRPDGPDGADGADGPDGLDGLDGADGSGGPDGSGGEGGAAEPDVAARVDLLLRASGPERRLLLIVDQMEEAFALAEDDERGRFFRALLALRAHPRALVLVCLRADFFADLIDSPLWIAEQTHHLVVGPLRGQALREAIVSPAQLAGVYVEPVLVERLLADASHSAHALPLVQEALIQLWELRARRALPLAAYERLGGDGGSGLGRALSRHADARLSELSPAQRKIARRVLLRLVSFGEGSQDSRWPRPASELELPGEPRAALESVLEHLTRARLVVRDARGDGGERLVELSHEALISSWAKLATWISRRRADGQRRRQLEHTAAAWVARGRGGGGLLEARELSEAQAWRRTDVARELGESAELAALFERSAQALRHRGHRTGAAAVMATVLVALLGVSFTAMILRGREIEAAQVQINRAMSDQGALVQSAQQRRSAHQEERARKRMSDEKPQQALRYLVSARQHLGGGEPGLALQLMFREATRAQLIASLWHEDQLEALALSPDGQLVATASADGTARLWHTSDGAPATLPLAHAGGAVTSVAFSPDGHRVISGGADGTARIWNLRGELVGPPLRHEGAVRVALFSPDGKIVLTGGADRVVRLWDAATAQLVGVPLLHLAPVGGAAFSRDGALVVTTSDDHSARVWRVAGGAAVTRPLPHRDNVVSAVFSRDGRRVLTATAEDGAKVWEVSGSKLAFLIPTANGLSSAAYSPDGNRIVTAGDNRSARLWDAKTGASLGISMLHDAGVNSAVFSADGGRILTVSEDKTARVWDAATGRPLAFKLAHEGVVRFAAFNREGTLAVTAGADLCARIWRIDVAPEGVRTFRHDKTVHALAFSADGAWLATGSSDKTARLWDVRESKLLMLFQHDRRVDHVAISPDRKLIATAGEDKQVRLWDPIGGEERTPALKHGDAVTGLAFSPDSTLMVTASRDQTVQVWDVAGGGKVSSPLMHPSPVTSMAISPDGKTLATGCQSGAVRLWDLHTHRPLSFALERRGSIDDLQFSPDGDRLLTVGKEAQARMWSVEVWNVADHSPVAVLPPDKEVETARYSPDGALIATAGRKLVTVWDAATGEQLLRHRYSDELHAIEWDPKGAWLAVAGKQNMVELWNVERDRRSLQEWEEIAARGAFVLGEGDELRATPRHLLPVRPYQQAEAGKKLERRSTNDFLISPLATSSTASDALSLTSSASPSSSSGSCPRPRTTP